MTVATLAPATTPDPERPENGGAVVSFAAYDALVRAMLATLAADAGGYPNQLGYLRDALGGTVPRPGAHPREYVPAAVRTRCGGGGDADPPREPQTLPARLGADQRPDSLRACGRAVRVRGGVRARTLAALPGAAR